MFAHHWDNVRPDIVSVGKALSGGIMPVSGAFCDDAIMSVIKPGDHGSTYGGSPLAMAVAKTAMQVLVEEGMIENALKMGDVFAEELSKLKSPIIADKRGRGLFRAIEVAHDSHCDGSDLAYILMDLGLLTKATHDYSLRLAPALIINETQIKDACKIIGEGV